MPMDGDARERADLESPRDAPQIFEELALGVVGQESGKRDLATLLAMHVQSTAIEYLNPAHAAPNALIIGPTGVGKTHAIRTAAEALQIPLAIADATHMSSSAFADESLDMVLIELVRSSRRLIREKSKPVGYDEPPDLDELYNAQRGIVFIDEFDKLAIRSGNREDRNELVQRRLLQFIDGASVTLSSSRHTGEDELTFQTAGILFVVAGAFTDLLADPGGRTHKAMRSMQRHNHVISEDIVRYGFMKELIARIPVIIEFSPLTEEDLTRILQTPSIDPSQFYVQYLRSLGTELKIKEDAQRWIAARAAELDVGARGLHQVLFPILSLLSQDMENDEDKRPDLVELDVRQVQDLARKVEGRRSDRPTR